MDKFEEARRLGLYLGAGVLGSIAGNVIYAVVFGTPVAVASSTGPPLWHLAFAVGAALFVWHSKQTVERLAWLAFLGYQAIIAYAAIANTRTSRPLTFFLLIAWATLWVAAAVRPTTARRVVIAGSVFLVVLLFSFSAQYYADVLLGRHSVMRSRWW